MIGSPLHMCPYHSAGPLREACALPFGDLFAKLAGFMEYRPLSIYWLRPRDLPKDRHPAEVMPVPRNYYFNEECGAWASPFLGEEYTGDRVGVATRWHDRALATNSPDRASFGRL